MPIDSRPTLNPKASSAWVMALSPVRFWATAPVETSDRPASRTAHREPMKFGMARADPPMTPGPTVGFPLFAVFSESSADSIRLENTLIVVDRRDDHRRAAGADRSGVRQGFLAS